MRKGLGRSQDLGRGNGSGLGGRGRGILIFLQRFSTSFSQEASQLKIMFYLSLYIS
jgi:hypothetical protein